MTLVPSARVVVEGQLLFLPFTQLGWDQNAPALVHLDKVAKLEHILQYGHPLCVLVSGLFLPHQLTNSQMGFTDGLHTHTVLLPHERSCVEQRCLKQPNKPVEVL